MAMTVVTGKRGEIHITSSQIQALNAGIFGSGAVVLDVNEKLAGQVISNNLVRVTSGHLVNQGVQSCINHGEYEELAITSGTSTTSRCDLICAHYTKNANTGVEDVELVVVAGTPVSSGTPEPPTVTRGNILNGALEDYCPLHKVWIKGLTIEKVELIPPISGMAEIDEKIQEVDTLLDDLAYTRIEGANEFEYDESKLEAKIRAYTYSKAQVDKMVPHLGTVRGDSSGGASYLRGYVAPVGNYEFVYQDCTFTIFYCSATIGMIFLNLRLEPRNIPKTGYDSATGEIIAEITDNAYKPFTNAVLNVWGGGTANPHAMIETDGKIHVFSNAKPTDPTPIFVSGFYVYKRQ